MPTYVHAGLKRIERIEPSTHSGLPEDGSVQHFTSC